MPEDMKARRNEAPKDDKTKGNRKVDRWNGVQRHAGGRSAIGWSVFVLGKNEKKKRERIGK